MRTLYVVLATVLAVAGLLAVRHYAQSRDDRACESTLQTVASPGGNFGAEVKDALCAWGFGLAANNVSVKVTKQGNDGWSYSFPLEYDGIGDDQGMPAPTLTWSGPNSLEIIVHTRKVSGVLTHREQELTIVRSYIASVVP
jgi:hypothetical protein